MPDQNKIKKHQLFRKHRIVVWEQDGFVYIGKVVDSTMKLNVLDPTIKVGEVVQMKRNPLSKETIKQKRVFLDHVITHDFDDKWRIPVKIMRLPTDRDRRIYKKYRL